MGGRTRSESQMENFRATLHDCGLGDLGYKGPRYTRRNKREPAAFIKERLDRAVANEEWCNKFPDFEVEVLAALSSDHNPMLLTLCSLRTNIKRPRAFKYEAAWHVDVECVEVVKAAWGSDIEGTDSRIVTQEKMVKCREALSEWSRNKFGLNGRRIRELTRRLGVLQHHEIPDNLESIKKSRGGNASFVGNGRTVLETESKVQLVPTWRPQYKIL